MARRSPPRPTGTRSPARSASGYRVLHFQTKGSALGAGVVGIREPNWVHSGLRCWRSKSLYSSSRATSSVRDVMTQSYDAAVPTHYRILLSRTCSGIDVGDIHFHLAHGVLDLSDQGSVRMPVKPRRRDGNA